MTLTRLITRLHRAAAARGLSEPAPTDAGTISLLHSHYEVESNGREPSTCRTIAEVAAKLVEFSTPAASVRLVTAEGGRPLDMAELAEVDRHARAIRLLAVCGETVPEWDEPARPGS